MTSAIRQSFPAARSPGSSPGAETELQKMLIDERSKCELHRGNYETLKAEHTGLRDEFIQIQEEVRHLQAQLERLQPQLADRAREILEKNREIEELRLQVITPQRLELLRAHVQQEMEGPVRDRFSKLEEEAEKYRSDFNTLRYSYTVLNAQFEHQKEEHARVVDEQKQRYETEIAHLDKDKENLVAQYQNADVHHDRKQMEIMLREKTQLALRLKALQAEVMELQAQKDYSGQQAEILQHGHNRQIAELQTSLKSLEAERQSLRMRLERMEGELRLSHEQNSQLMGQLHKAEKQVNSLNCLIESLKHSHKMEVASIKLECTRCKGELARERDALKAQIEGLQTELELLKNMVERHKDILVEKEREAARKVQAAHDEEISKSTQLHEEKLELEYRLAVLEQQMGLQDAKEQAHRDESEERLRSAQRDVLRKTQQSLKTRLKQQSAQLEELERQTSEISLLKQNNQELRAELSSSSRARAELTGANQRLQAEVGDMREKLRAARVQAERSQHEAERRAEESQIEWLEEKHKFEERKAKLEEKYSQLKDKMKKVSVAQKKRRNQTEYKEKNLQHKVQLLKAQMEELKLEAAAANKRPLHAEENAQLRRRMRELQRRHNEFRRLLLGDQANYTFAPTLTSRPNSFHISDAGSTVPDEEEHKEIILLRERMDELEKAQQRHLEELDGCR